MPPWPSARSLGRTAVPRVAKDQHRQAGNLPARRQSGLQALVSEGRGEAYVQDRHVRSQANQSVKGRWSGLHGGDDRVAVGFEQADQAVAEEKEVFGYDYSHGTVKLTRVGPPAGLSASTCPSKAASRRAMPSNPEPGNSCRAAGPVVGHHDRDNTAAVRELDGGVCGVGVLDDVGEQLGDGEVEGCLDGPLGATFDRAPNLDLDGGVQG